MKACGPILKSKMMKVRTNSNKKGQGGGYSATATWDYVANAWAPDVVPAQSNQNNDGGVGKTLAGFGAAASPKAPKKRQGW